MSLIKKIITNILPPIIIKLVRKKYKKNNSSEYKLKLFIHPRLSSYSQYNEDLILDALLNCKPSGFYVDIGANDPQLLSNTQRFYKKGWTGINIEPNIIQYKKFIEMRPNDINLNVGIGSSNKEMDFYILTADTLSTFDKEEALKNEDEYGEKIIKKIKVPVHTLNFVLDKYLGDNKIDFMSIDVEGYEMNVLKSNDWNQFRPQFLLIEINRNTDEIKKYLNSLGYELVFNNDTNGLFVDNLR